MIKSTYASVQFFISSFDEKKKDRSLKCDRHGNRLATLAWASKCKQTFFLATTCADSPDLTHRKFEVRCCFFFCHLYASKHLKQERARALAE